MPLRSAAAAPPPPCGEDRLGRRPSEKGVAGHRAPCPPGTQSPSAARAAPTDRVGPAPAADARRVGFDREPYARRPPPRSGLRPSRSSPTRGEGNCPGFVIMTKRPPSGRGRGGEAKFFLPALDFAARAAHMTGVASALPEESRLIEARDSPARTRAGLHLQSLSSRQPLSRGSSRRAFARAAPSRRARGRRAHCIC